jgi:two-component system sensor histidine kinase QseC
MLGIFGVVGYAAHWVSLHEAEEIFSARLATSARVLESLVARQLETATIASPIVISLPAALEQAQDDAGSEAGHPYEGKIAFQVWSAQGVMLAKTASSPAEMLGPMESGFHEYVSDAVWWHVFALRSGSVWIFAAEKHDVRDEMAEDIAVSVLTPLIVGGLMLIVFVHLFALRAIRPVEDLAHAISGRAPDSLLPIPLADVPQELVPVVRALNDLLGRVRSAFSREKRMIDAAAHELRTPIAAVQLHVQNALSAPSEEERIASIELSLAAARRVSQMAEQLLVYSRVSASPGMEPLQRVDLAELTRATISLMQPLLTERQATVILRASSPGLVWADPNKMERLVRNLLDNAIQYGQMPGEVVIQVSMTPSGARWSIENDGDSIPEAEQAKIFIPYYRIVGSAGFGSGLGLSIVQEIVQQAGGQIRIEERSEGRGVRFVVDFPFSPETVDPSVS